MIKLLLAAGILAAAGIAGDAPLAWMAGDWATSGPAERWTLERWSLRSDGNLDGRGEERSRNTVRSWEKTRIAFAQGKATYYAAPMGGPEVAFVEVSRGPAEIVFENRAHDYPQRIRYWRDGAVLMAETSLADGGRPMRWRYCRLDADLRVSPPCTL